MPGTSHEQDLLVVHNILSTPFQVLWGGQPFSIEAGQQKVYPRYLAEHMAKHLADRHLLMQEEQYKVDHGGEAMKNSLLNDKEKRTEAVKEILPSVYQYYLEQPQQGADQKLQADIEAANERFTTDLKPQQTVEIKDEAPVNKALGVLKENPKTPEPPKAKADAPSLVDKNKRQPTKAELIADLEALDPDIELTGNESVEELIAKIKAF